MTAVIVVVPVGSQFVLIQESKAPCRGQWSLPGGVVEPGESLVAAVCREVLEEAGLHVEPTGIIAIEHVECARTSAFPYDLKMRYIVAAKALTTTLKTKEDVESQRAGLFTVEQVRGLDLRFSSYLTWLEAFLSGSSHLPIERYFHKGTAK